MKLHKKSRYISVVVLGLLMSCRTTPEANKAGRTSPVLAEPKSNLSVELDTLLEKNTTGRVLLDLPKVQNLSEDKLAELKAFFKAKNSSAVASEKAKKHKINIVDHIKKSEFRELQDVSLDEVVRATGKLKNEVAEHALTTLAKANTCEPAHVSLAFGTLAERKFPDTQAIAQATELYEKAYSCGTGEIKARAAYRLGLFAMAQDDCNKSKDYWNAVTSVNEVKFLFSRAEYWKNYCLSRETQKPDQQRAVAMDFYNSYPLSFHTIQVFKESKEELGNVVLARANPKIQIRSERVAQLNTLVEQIENAIEAKKFEQAREYYSWLSGWAADDRLDAVEPHFRLYLGYLSYAAQDGLDAFQILSKTFSQYPELKSMSTLKIFYPKWYFAEIQKAAEQNGLDPLLVISLVRQESAFNKSAVSRVGARGLMQIMPRTARTIDRKLKKVDLLKPELNIKAGTVYFAGLVKRYNGNVALALAAYNAGFGAVDKWVERYKVTNPLLFADLIPYRETREYVGSILRNLYWYQALENRSALPKVIIGDLQLAPKKDI